MPTETRTAICAICGSEYEDTYIIPRAPYAPFWCGKCRAMAEAACGGVMGCIYQASQNPIERGDSG